MEKNELIRNGLGMKSKCPPILPVADLLAENGKVKNKEIRRNDSMALRWGRENGDVFVQDGIFFPGLNRIAVLYILKDFCTGLSLVALQNHHLYFNFRAHSSRTIKAYRCIRFLSNS